MKYNWQQADWPLFRYDLHKIEDELYACALQIAEVNGTLKALAHETKTEALLSIMVAEAIKTSAIEGEHLHREDVMSSVRNQLGLNKSPQQVKDKKAKGAAELMMEVRSSFAEKLSAEMLFGWHRTLFQYGPRISIGAWRSHDEPMQIVSGAHGREKVHFEAPPSKQVPAEMQSFISWFNDSAPAGPQEIKQAPVRAAIAHLYFETIHPFEDGNGRIGRAVAEKALSQTTGRPVLLSLSHAIEADKSAYYAALKQAQRSNEITPWLAWFTRLVREAQQQAAATIAFSLQKARYLSRYEEQLNERQLKVVKRMLDEGPDGFEGGMSAKKYMSLTKASKATATRDLQSLLEQGALRTEGAGRSTRYYIDLG